MGDLALPDSLRDELRTAWDRYLDHVAPLRPALHAYCRRLTGNLWDAEDLVQDSLLRAFGTLGRIQDPVRSLFDGLYRLEGQDGRVVRLRAYGFCPEVVREVGEKLGLPVLTGLYRAPSPGPGLYFDTPG